MNGEDFINIGENNNKRNNLKKYLIYIAIFLLIFVIGVIIFAFSNEKNTNVLPPEITGNNNQDLFKPIPIEKENNVNPQVNVASNSTNTNEANNEMSENNSANSSNINDNSIRNNNSNQEVMSQQTDKNDTENNVIEQNITTTSENNKSRNTTSVNNTVAKLDIGNEENNLSSTSKGIKKEVNLTQSNVVNKKTILKAESKAENKVKKVAKKVTKKKVRKHYHRIHGYYVQVSAFIKTKPTTKFLRLIRKYGYHYIFYRVKIKKDGKRIILTKVLIGPFRNKKEAERNLAKIKKYITPNAFIYRVR